MSSEIICNVTGRETRMALIENGQLAELQIDRGIIEALWEYLPWQSRSGASGMQAAFVDIGLERCVSIRYISTKI